MSFDDVFQFPKKLLLYVGAQVDDRSSQAVVLKPSNTTCERVM